MGKARQSSPIWDNLFRPKPAWQEAVTTLWAKTPLFQEIPIREINLLAANMHPRQFSADEPVFHSGDLGIGAALILEGEVEIRVEQKVIATLKRGDFFGEVALVSDERRTADAIATSNTEIAFFLRLDLEEWLDHSPRLGARFVMNLAYVLTERLRLANQQLGRTPEPKDP